MKVNVQNLLYGTVYSIICPVFCSQPWQGCVVDKADSKDTGWWKTELSQVFAHVSLIQDGDILYH